MSLRSLFFNQLGCFMFSHAMEFVEGWEGGWSNDAADPGGLTKWGVTIRTVLARALDFNGDGRINADDLRDMTKAQARALYKSDYWDAAACNKLPGPLALLVFDGAVNQGVGRATRILQATVGAKPDGDIGPKTHAAIVDKWFADPKGVLREYCVRRALHYTSLSIFVRFGRGWFRRLFDACLTAGEWLEQPAEIAPKDVGFDPVEAIAIVEEARAVLSGLTLRTVPVAKRAEAFLARRVK